MKPTPWAVSPELSTRAFDRVRAMIHDYAGISLNASKRNMVMNRLSRRLRATGIASFEAYLDLVAADDCAERTSFVNALTTNLTSFFREAHHFPALVEHLRAQATERSPITVWSAACSTGEEPYSIAIAAMEAFDTDRPPVRIVASDLDTQALETASRGVYSLEKMESVSEERRRRFFLRGTGAHDGTAKIRPAVRALVEFSQVNLQDDDWPVDGPLAAIFCRNVMIYFNRDTQLAILKRFAPLIAPGGLLFAGHSENFHYLAGDFLRTRGKTVYESVA